MTAETIWTGKILAYGFAGGMWLLAAWGCLRVAQGLRAEWRTKQRIGAIGVEQQLGRRTP